MYNGIKKLISILLCVFCIIPFSSVSSSAEVEYGHVYCRNSSNAKKIALTFDDGPHPRYTEEILQILEEYEITATFFIIGVNAEHYPEELQKIVRAGCEIGNHTYSHPKLRHLEPESIRNELQQCENVLYRLTGTLPRVFRPPEGLLSENLWNGLQATDYSVVLWSIDTLDWAMTPSTEISNNVINNLRGGDIILMHDYVSGGNTTCDALRLIIPTLLEKGYEFVTVSELIGKATADESAVAFFHDSVVLNCFFLFSIR